MAECD